MKKNYDFSKAEKGLWTRPRESLQILGYLDADLQRKLAPKAPKGDLSKLVNRLLCSQVRAAKMIGR